MCNVPGTNEVAQQCGRSVAFYPLLYERVEGEASPEETQSARALQVFRQIL